MSDRFDGELRRFSGSGALGTGDQSEDQQPLFVLADGAVLENVIIGAPGADGIHCKGSCQLHNVWWEDVGEDAATMEASADSASDRMVIQCGGARHADDKVFQHNGAGSFEIRDFWVEDFGKLYRACGNCSTSFERHVVVSNVTATDGDILVGINVNFGDTATFSNVDADDITLCQRFNGVPKGSEPSKTEDHPEACIYQ